MPNPNPNAVNTAVARRRYHFWGQVQGVGFRYRAQYAAQFLGLTGWVKNLDDGSVEAEVQGDPNALERFVPTLLTNSHWIEISQMEQLELPPLPPDQSRRFTVRGY